MWPLLVGYVRLPHSMVAEWQSGCVHGCLGLSMSVPSNRVEDITVFFFLT